MGISMDERIERAERGREYWLKIVNDEQIDNSCYVVILPNDTKYYEVALAHLDDFLKKKHAKRCVVVSSNFEKVTSMLNEEKHDFNISVVACTTEDIVSLIQFYSLYEFSSNIVIASLEEPAGRLGTGINGEKCISMEEVFVGIVYGLYQ